MMARKCICYVLRVFHFSQAEAKEPYMQSKAKLKELQLCMVETYMPAIGTQYCSAAERLSN